MIRKLVNIGISVASGLSIPLKEMNVILKMQNVGSKYVFVCLYF